MLHPIARTNDLIVTEVGADLLLFDETTDHLHHLERDAAVVWRAADGTRSVTDLAEAGGLTSDEVQVVLAQLTEATLIAMPQEACAAQTRLDRRRVLKRAGLAAGVISVSAPVAAQAQTTTCVPFNQCAQPAWGQTCCNTGLICAYDMRDRWYACFAPVFCDDPDFWQVQCWPA